MRIAACAVVLAAWTSPARASDAGVDAGSSVVDGGVILVPVPNQPVDMPEVTAAATGDEVELATPFYVFVTVRHPVNTRVNLPATLEFGGTFEVLRHTSRTTRAQDGRSIREFELEVIAWDAGDFLLPAIPITYVASGSVYTVPSNAVPLRVRSFVGAGDETPKGLRPPVSVDRRDLTILYIILAAAGLACVSFVAFLLLRWRRRRRVPRVQVPVRVPRGPADEEALHRLEALRASGQLDTDDRKPPYLTMSDIVRDFLSRRFGFAAMDLTTSEIAERLAGHDEGRFLAHAAREWLEDVALVKYANYKPTAEQAADVLNRACQLIVDSRTLAQRVAAERAHVAGVTSAFPPLPGNNAP